MKLCLGAYPACRSSGPGGAAAAPFFLATNGLRLASALSRGSCSRVRSSRYPVTTVWASSPRATGALRSSSKNGNGLAGFSNRIASAQADSAVVTMGPIQVSASFGAEFGAPRGGVMAGEDHVRNPGWFARVWEARRHRLRVGGHVIAGRRRRERRRALDHCGVVVQPFAVVEGDGCDDAALAAIRDREAEVLGRALGEDDLIAEGAHADTLDVDAELAGPELWQR